MAKGLEGVRAKIERAVKSFNELHTPIKDWCEGHPYLSVVDHDYNTGWHLAHHVDMGIPFRHLPAFHAELERAGYITPGLTYPNYRSLWRALASA